MESRFLFLIIDPMGTSDEHVEWVAVKFRTKKHLPAPKNTFREGFSWDFPWDFQDVPRYLRGELRTSFRLGREVNMSKEVI